MSLRAAFVKHRYVASGGGERYLEWLLRGCAGRGHEVHVITTGWPEGERSPWRVHAVPAASGPAARRLRAFSRAAARQAREGGFDVTVSLERTECQDVWRAGEGVHRVWLDRRRSFEPAWKVWLSRRTARQRALLDLEAAAVARTPFVIANSDLVRRDIESVYGGRHGRIAVIHNGVPADRFTLDARDAHRRDERARRGLGPDQPLLLFVGSGFRRKGLAELLAALASLPDARLIVLGRDPPGPWRAAARRAGAAGRAAFDGTAADLVPLYHAADAVVLPTWFDSFSNVGLEAMRCGTPFVTTRFAGAHELVRPGANGEVVASPAAIGELAAAIRRAVEAGRAPGAAARIAASVADFTMDRNVRMTLEVIEEAARQRAAAARDR